MENKLPIPIHPVLIENKLNPNSHYYQSCHSKKVSEGELFEINIYENLLSWAAIDDNIKWVCSKQKKQKEKFDGLGRNYWGQIVYFVDFLSFAEFDMLFFYNDILINIEATTIANSNNSMHKYIKKIKKITLCLRLCIKQIKYLLYLF